MQQDRRFSYLAVPLFESFGIGVFAGASVLAFSGWQPPANVIWLGAFALAADLAFRLRRSSWRVSPVARNPASS